MNMKINLKLMQVVSLLFLITLAFSCDDFLDTKPLSNGVFIDETDEGGPIYANASELESALSGAYADFKNEYFMLDYFVNGDAQSDNAYAGGDDPDNFQLRGFDIDPSNNNVSRDWGYLYGTIGKVNRVRNNADSVRDAALTTQRRNEIKGEAAFIRAYIYFQMVQLWGEVPLVTEEVTSINVDNIEEIYPLLFPERATVAEIYEQIIVDLEYALANVRTTAPNKEFATKGAANAMLAKVYATIEPHDWNKVSEYCDAVIAGGYTLVGEYTDLWSMNNNENENTTESILEINCYNWDSGGNWGVYMFDGTDWKKFNTPTNDLVAAYEAEGDVIRLNANVRFADVTGVWTDQYWPLNHYPFINKYQDFSGAQNFILIRLADILLLKAEALNELNQVTEAAALVNQVRARVDLGPTPAATQDAMRLAIENERRLELAFEGHRWYDLKRTGRAIPVINALEDGSGTNLGYVLTPEKMLWPIPQQELDKNEKLTQNDGY
jgi:hypothetical protein